MPTEAQINAAVANAQHSTGPRTVEGKAISSRNATKLGIFAQADILPGEDPEQYAALIREFEDIYHPVGSMETQLMLDIARGIWLEHRYNRIEQEVIQIRRESLSAADLDKPLGHIYLQDTSNVLGKIESRRNTARRRADRAKRELLNLQIQRSFIEHPPVRVIPQEVKQLPANPVRFEKSPQPVISVAAPSPKPAATASAFAPKQELGNPALRL